MSKLKLWFIKGAGIEKDSSGAVRESKPRQQQQRRHVDAAAATPAYHIDPARPDLVPPRDGGGGPRPLLPRAVRAGEAVSRRPNEVENESLFSTSTNTQSTGLTSVQQSSSRGPSARSRSKRTSNNNNSNKRRSGGGGLSISRPVPTKSLLDLASGYADVQNPQTAYSPTGRPPVRVETAATASSEKPPLHSHDSSDRRRHQRFHPDQPVREVSSGRAQIVVQNPPSHQRSQKTVVRKALSPPLSSCAQRAADSDDRDCRHMSHVTVFEDFMGKNSSDKDPLPPMPALPFAANSNNAPALNHRLSRPFREEAAEGFEDVVEEEWDNEDEGNIDPETMPVSPTGS
ncbi:MAG: hypothetical protein Q9193_006973, partial [Seirophora villosa]